MSDLLTKQEVADLIWNEGILPIITDDSVVLNAGDEVLPPTQKVVATYSFTQNVGSWHTISSSDPYVYGPAGYNAKDGYEQMYSGRGPALPQMWMNYFSAYTYSASAYGTSVSCTIVGSAGAQSAGSQYYGDKTQTASLVISTTDLPSVGDGSQGYEIYIQYLTDRGWFNDDFKIINSRSYGFALLCAVEFLLRSMVISLTESTSSITKYYFIPDNPISVNEFPTVQLSDLASTPTLSNSGISSLFNAMVSSFGERIASDAYINSVTITTSYACSSSSSSSCSSSSSSSSCSSSSCSSSSCSSSCSSSIFIAYYNIGGI